MHRLFPLLICLLICLTSSMSAQVGVNNPNPTQALDIEGKVKLTNDNRPPSDGTVRYNDIEADFEGYSEGEWKSLTKSAGADVSIPIPASYYSFSVPSTGVWDEAHVDQREVWLPGPINTSFSEFDVPAGYIYVVDQICLTGRDGSGSTSEAFFYGGVRRRVVNGGLNPQIFMSGSRRDGTKCMQAGRNPIMVLRAGQSFEFFNGIESETNIRIAISGAFMTDIEQYYRY